MLGRQPDAEASALGKAHPKCLSDPQRVEHRNGRFQKPLETIARPKVVRPVGKSAADAVGSDDLIP